MDNKSSILEIIRSTRELSLPSWGSAPAEYKGGNPQDLVTELDRKIEVVLKEKFAEIEPDTHFVGEETGGKRDSDSFWLVDPIDGTSHYVRGLPFCTTMVTKVVNQEVVFSAIYDFVSDIMYHAELGKGAFADDTPISVSSRTAEESQIGYESKLGEPDTDDKYQQVRGKMRTLHLLCSGYEHAMVATGKIDGRVGYEPYGHDYDFAPGCLLIREAGGVVSTIGSENYDYQNTNYIAANKNVHEALVSDADAPFPVK